MRVLVFALLMFVVAVASRADSGLKISDVAINSPAASMTISGFGFFNGGPDKPSPRLIGYRLRNPLFSDYSEKQRFIYLPEGTKIDTDADGRIQFPVGAALIKNFGYRDASGKLDIIETRLLLHQAEGWLALPYVWRPDRSNADLKVGGARLPVSFKKPNGQDMAISYSVPNKNQCKQCHSSNGKIVPIGPTVTNMVFTGVQGDPFAVSAVEAAWDDPAAKLDDRAQAYLRINCGHCHKPSGSASNSGLFFDDHIGGGAAQGIGKRPVAAGRGSGNFDFVIEPGHPERSILIHRMKSTDPGVAMPELGRATAHDEGVKLLDEWIRGMKPTTTP
ncbi:MAG: hypothetical protein RL481_143 [Pseudomonadota bacterium]